MKVIFIIVVLFAVSIGLLNYAISKEFDFHTKGVIVVTGSSSGIGRNASFDLAERGYVVFCGVRKEKDIQSLNDEAKKKNLEINIVPIILDVTSSRHIADTLETVTNYVNKHGLPLVGIVNNAGIAFRIPVEVAPLGEVKSLFNINYFSTIEITQTFLPLLKKYKGRIVFVSSVSGVVSTYGSGFYSGSKRAMEALVDSLRVEMNPFGVSVSSVLPGYIKTDIVDKVRDHKDFNLPEEKYELYKNFFDSVKDRRKRSFEVAVGPEVTSRAIAHALTDPYPKTRYVVGPAGPGILTGNVVYLLSGILPDRLIDLLKSNS